MWNAGASVLFIPAVNLIIRMQNLENLIFNWLGLNIAKVLCKFLLMHPPRTFTSYEFLEQHFW